MYEEVRLEEVEIGIQSMIVKCGLEKIRIIDTVVKGFVEEFKNKLNKY